MRRHARFAALLVVVAALFAGRPASAQGIELSGVLGAHHPRGSARAGRRTRAWATTPGCRSATPGGCAPNVGRVAADAARAPVQAAPVDLRLPRRRQPAHLDRCRRRHAALIKLNTQIQWQEQKREIWMDGRAASAGVRAAYLAGLLDRSSGTGNVLVVRTTHLKAGWIRRNGLCAERPRDDGGALHPPRRLPHARLHHRGPVLPHGAAHQDQRLPL